MEKAMKLLYQSTIIAFNPIKMKKELIQQQIQII